MPVLEGEGVSSHLANYPMRRLLKIAGISLAVLMMVAAGLGWWAWHASQQVPEFYQQALDVPKVELVENSDVMLKKSLDLKNRMQEKGGWDVTFTAKQINGWLAVDLVENHRNSLPDEIRDPRVALSADGVKLACRYVSDNFATVFWLHGDVSLHESNVIALRLYTARAGELPLPMSEVLEIISEAVQAADLHLRWTTVDDDPVALITIPAFHESTQISVRLERVELKQDAIRLSGQNEPRREALSVAGQPGNLRRRP